VRDQAASWLARINDGALTAQEQAAFDAWLNEHEHHADEYRVLQQLWGAADLIPRARLQALCETVEPMKSRPVRQRTITRYAVAASLTVVLLGGGVFFAMTRQADYSADFTTTLGERRQVKLPDGSLLDLNGRTRLSVAFQSGSRHVELLQGEAMFSVEHDASRPFVVNAGNGSVTVTGTRFDVRRDPGQTLVAVESGTVKVKGRDDQPDALVTLTAGLGSRIDSAGRVAPASAVDTAALTAWRAGKLVFNDAPLSEVVQEVSRYRDKPLRVTNDKTAQLRLSSVFKSDDTDALLRALPSILPVAVRSLADGSQEIIAR
jgi:transmembrane sensor